jgi:hypothetical protein
MGGRKEHGMQIERAPRQATKLQSGPPSGLARRSPSSKRWLIVREGGGRLEPLCVQAGTARVLPVFSFEEEAEMFLRFGGYDGDGWRARESRAGEMVSVLHGPCADAKGVVLDPLPAMLEDGTVDLVGVGRKSFLRQLLASDREETPPRCANRPRGIEPGASSF